METAGSIESVLLLEREYKALQRDPSHRPNFYFLIDRLISNLRYIPRTVFGPPAGEEERIKLTKLREEEGAEEAEAAQRAAERADEGSASRKRKLEELEEKKCALEEENDRKRKELEEESRRLKAVEEAERRAREQRSRNPKVQVPVASEKEKGETWFERKATELVENYIQSYGPQQKKSKEAAETYTTACKNSEQAHEDFISALQKTQEKAEVLQKCLGRALEAAMAFGREEERAQQYAQAKDKKYRELKPDLRSLLDFKKESGKREPSRKSLVNLGRRKDLKYQRQPKPGPFWGVRARKQPAEEEPGKEWREKISEDVWKVGRLLKEDEKYLECTYYPFSPEWQEKLREELLNLAHRGFAKKEDGELCPTRRFGWQLQSTREFRKYQPVLGARLWSQVGMEKPGSQRKFEIGRRLPLLPYRTGKDGESYEVRGPVHSTGDFTPSKSMCSICWSEGHWKSGCQLKDMVFELWEPALAVLVPAERLRKYYPCREYRMRTVPA